MTPSYGTCIDGQPLYIAGQTIGAGLHSAIKRERCQIIGYCNQLLHTKRSGCLHTANGKKTPAKAG